MSAPKPSSFLKHATEVASFYGFRPHKEIERIAANRLAKRKGANSFEALATLAGVCLALRPQDPVLAYYATPSPSHLPKNLSPRESGEFGLQVIGTPESVGEVVLLKTVTAILNEWGASIARVRVNALGDKDSQQRFAREVSSYLRKHEQKFDESCRGNTGNPLHAYVCNHESCRAVLSEGPRSMNFLSERSRTHFKSVLEHLENLGLPYELDDLLVGDGRDPHVTFAIDLADNDSTVLAAMGGRYDDFFKRLSTRKESHGVGASLYFRKKGTSKSNFTAPKTRAPKVYFVQLGLRAKLQGLTVVDMLRAARIPVSQSFDATHLSPQLASARDLGVSHTLIMGQREALDGTIIVRSMKNSSQTIVQVTNLPKFLKTLQK